MFSRVWKETSGMEWVYYIFMLLEKEAATGGVLYENLFSEISQNSHENICNRVSFLIKLQAKACNFINKETLAQVFSCEFCKISTNIFLTAHLRVTAPVERNIDQYKQTKSKLNVK